MERKYGSVAAGKLKHKVIKVEKLCHQLTEGIKHIIFSQHMNNFNSTQCSSTRLKTFKA